MIPIKDNYKLNHIRINKGRVSVNNLVTKV